MQQRSLRQIIADYREAVAEDGADLPVWVRMILAFFESHPDPAWIKAVLTKDGRLQMIRVNRAYQEQVGISPEQYQGLDDGKLWDADTADQFNRHDHEAMFERGPIRRIEYITHPITGIKQRWNVWKWPIITDGEVTAVCGCAVLDREYDLENGN